MLFNVFWTILLGVIGGIISSLIVSRVLLIQNKYQEQISFVNRIIRKLGYISASLEVSKAVFEVSYDEDIKMEREMKEKGYKTEMEYYAAHKDQDWISKQEVLDVFKKEIDESAESIQTEIANKHVEDEKLNHLLNDVMDYTHQVSSINELSFSSIKSFKKREQDLMDSYEKCIHLSGETLIKLIFRDKCMIVLFLILVLLVAGTVMTKIIGI